MLSIIKQSRWLLVIITILLASQAFGHGMSEADKQSMIDGGNLRYIWLGTTHMLTGYDHLLFIFGVIFFLTGFRDIVKFITVFTVGHSITLTFATILGISANYFLVDALIALSVCYKGFDNLDGFKKYMGMKSPNLVMVIFGFGLIHGFGLSTRLQQLPLGESGLIMRILSFNLGVEFGQVIALAFMLLLISTWRKTKSFAQFSAASNAGLIAAGLFLFIMQMHGYGHTSNPEEFVVHAEPSMQVESNQQMDVAGNSETSQQAGWKDSISITIPARGDKEYKFRLVKGATLEYDWQTSGAKLFFDFHGEPAGDTTGYFKSFRKSTDSQSSGSLITSFEGTHGWYWKNNNSSPVIITLKVKGEYQRLDLKEGLSQAKPVQKLNPTTHDTID